MNIFENHVKVRLLEQAQAWGFDTHPPLWSRLVSIPQVVVSDLERRAK